MNAGAVTERQRLQAEAGQSLAEADWDAPHATEPTDGESTLRDAAKGLTTHLPRDVEPLLPVGAIVRSCVLLGWNAGAA